MNTRRRDTPERAQSLKRWAAPLASFKFHYSIVSSFFIKRHTFLLCRCANSSECSGRRGQISNRASVDELTYQQHGTVDSTAVRFYNASQAVREGPQEVISQKEQPAQ